MWSKQDLYKNPLVEDALSVHWKHHQEKPGDILGRQKMFYSASESPWLNKKTHRDGALFRQENWWE